jgi:hypothetical protein
MISNANPYSEQHLHLPGDAGEHHCGTKGTTSSSLTGLDACEVGDTLIKSVNVSVLAKTAHLVLLLLVHRTAHAQHNISLKPMIALSGVRNSCDTLAGTHSYTGSFSGLGGSRAKFLGLSRS